MKVLKAGCAQNALPSIRIQESNCRPCIAWCPRFQAMAKEYRNWALASYTLLNQAQLHLLDKIIYYSLQGQTMATAPPPRKS
jgi:hypothetical protein